MPVKLLAFYYPWYGSSEHARRHWAQDNILYTPTLGEYDSHNPDLIEQHIKWAKEAGIDGFIVSWWGIGTYEDEAMQVILEKAKKFNFKITPFYETIGGQKDVSFFWNSSYGLNHAKEKLGFESDIAYEAAKADLQHILNNYAKHKAYLRIRRRPAITIYSRVTIDLLGKEMTKEKAIAYTNFWQRLKKELNNPFLLADFLVPFDEDIYKQAIKGFDGICYYGMFGRQKYRLSTSIKAAKKFWIPSVTPGFDNTRLAILHNFQGYFQGRVEGRYYEEMWQEATKTSPDAIAIISWNEWHESTFIEPSKELGNFYLEITQKLKQGWLQPNET